jgi:uncharacterized membrane protein
VYKPEIAVKNFSKEKVSSLQIAYEVLAASGLLFHIVLITRAWASLPSTIPVHYGLSGQPNAWGGKIELLELPVVSVILYVGLTWLARYPHKLNPWTITERNAEQLYRLAKSSVGAVKGLLVWLFTAITWQTIRVAMGQTGGLGGAFIAVILGITGITVVVYVLLGRSAAQA